ncbi:zf-DNL-domain-containing protein [Suillus hirtellus]|nr:zf-DNL-domain-containing protein [Suillus hirtellus]
MFSSKLFRNINNIRIPYRVHVTPCTKLTSRRVSQTACLSFGTTRSKSSVHPDTPRANLSVSPSSEQIKDDSPIQEARLGIIFTCTAEACSHRSSHTFTKRAYERGIVIVQCPGCKNRHLIADNLDWFKDSTEDGKLRNIEDLLKARGESVQRGFLDANGVVEYADIEFGRK